MSAASREYYDDWQQMLTNDPDFYNWLNSLEQGNEHTGATEIPVRSIGDTLADRSEEPGKD